MLKSIIRSKEIIEIQGFKIFLEKFQNYYLSSDYDSKIKSTIKKYAKDYELFVDIGAGVGYVTLGVAKLFSKCICVEPSPENFHQLKSNITTNNLTNIDLYNIALSNQNGKQNFYVSKLNRFNSRLTQGVWESDEKFDTVNVNVETLSRIFEKNNYDKKCIIKIDVEGLELDVLRGASDILENDCIIISEYYPFLFNLNKTDPMDYYYFLHSFGYDFFDLNDKKISLSYIKKISEKGIHKKYIVDDFIIKKLN